MSSPHQESPFNTLPPVVAALALAIFGIEAAFQLGARGIVGGPGAVGWRLGAVRDYAVIGDVFDQMWALNVWPVEHVLRLVAYPFVHASFTHALFVIVFVLALGKMVGEVISAPAVLAVFFGSAVVGALVYAWALDDPAPLIGGFPAAYGLIGAFTFLLWARLRDTGGPQARAFLLIGFLMGIQLVFGLLFGGGRDWVADLAGFCTGFLLCFVVTPGGWARVMDRLRRR
ncbi:MAG: rhomboid family intramembrane serine protease [Rhodobacter sp.]|nr:rhomboid family intramembrane serine protease [Rhodobacter sp.]